MIIRAKHESICPVCGDKIKTGDRVVWNKGVMAYHEACPDADYRLPPPQAGSIRMFLEDHSEEGLRTGVVYKAGIGVNVVPTHIWGRRLDADCAPASITRLVCVDCRPATDDEIISAAENQRLFSYLDRLDAEADW